MSILVNPSHFWSIMFQTHTSGQFFTLLVNPSHVWSITSGRCFLGHACNFWSILYTSNQSVTLLPVTSGQSLTLPEGQFCTGQSGSRCNQRARQCIGAATGRTASIWNLQRMKGFNLCRIGTLTFRQQDLDVNERLFLSHRNSDIPTARSGRDGAAVFVASEL